MNAFLEVINLRCGIPGSISYWRRHRVVSILTAFTNVCLPWDVVGALSCDSKEIMVISLGINVSKSEVDMMGVIDKRFLERVKETH